MSERNGNPASQARSSRQRYRGFVEDYKRRRLDDSEEGADDQKRPADPPKEGEKKSPEPSRERRGKRREYLREYLHWLRPHRYAVVALFVLALVAAGLGMIEPLFLAFS